MVSENSKVVYNAHDHGNSTGSKDRWKVAFRSGFLASFQKMQDLAQQPLPWNNYFQFLTKANYNVTCAARYYFATGSLAAPAAMFAKRNCR